MLSGHLGPGSSDIHSLWTMTVMRICARGASVKKRHQWSANRHPSAPTGQVTTLHTSIPVTWGIICCKHFAFSSAFARQTTGFMQMTQFNNHQESLSFAFNKLEMKHALKPHVRVGSRAFGGSPSHRSVQGSISQI